MIADPGVEDDLTMQYLRPVLSGAAALAAVLVFAGGALAKPAYVASTVNLRESPGTTSEIVGKIPGGSLLDVGECTEGWCAVTWQSKVGYAIETALDMSGRVPQTRRTVRRPVYGPDYIDEPVYYAPPPPVFFGRPYYYGRHYYGHRRHRW
jgi:uncharacterized protein YraI